MNAQSVPMRRYESPRSGADVRAEFLRRGLSISAWARSHGYSAQLVYQVLAGRRECVRGQCHEIAVRLGMKDGIIGSSAEIDALSPVGVGQRGEEEDAE